MLPSPRHAQCRYRQASDRPRRLSRARDRPAARRRNRRAPSARATTTSGKRAVAKRSWKTRMTERRRLYHHIVSSMLHVPAWMHATRLSCVRHVTPLNLCDSFAWITQHMKMHPLTLGLLHAMAATALLTATATARAQEAAPTVAAASAVELDKVVVTGEIVYRDRSDATAPVLSYGLDYFQ